jgi:hypothetical protein
MSSTFSNLSEHEQGLANLITEAWHGCFPHFYPMPARRGKSARWVAWHQIRHPESPEQWRCANLADAAKQYAWDEITEEQRNSDTAHSLWTSEECRVALQSSLTNPQLFFNACLQTFKWGGVGRKRKGQDNASVAWLNNALSDGTLIEKVSRGVALLKGDENPENHFGKKLPMNSAMTKVYAFADPKRELAIYDGRVGAALDLFVMKYWKPTNSELPEELNFGYFDSQSPGKSGSRNPSIGRFKFKTLNSNGYHASCMWRANLILRASARALSRPTLDLERALFMIGYDVSTAKQAYA